MKERIEQLREKTHLDIPIVTLSIMFSLSLNKFDFTAFHVLFTLLIFSLIITKAMLWHLTAILSKKCNHFIIIASYVQISLLFAVYYSFSANHGVASAFYAGYAIFLLFYVVLLCIQFFKFGDFEQSQTWAVALIFIHLIYFAFVVVSVSIPYGVEMVVIFNICLVLLVGYAFERQAKILIFQRQP